MVYKVIFAYRHSTQNEGKEERYADDEVRYGTVYMDGEFIDVEKNLKKYIDSTENVDMIRRVIYRKKIKNVLSVKVIEGDVIQTQKWEKGWQ